jgi:hypothetical protein
MVFAIFGNTTFNKANSKQLLIDVLLTEWKNNTSLAALPQIIYLKAILSLINT